MTGADPHAQRRRDAAINGAVAAATQLRMQLEGLIAAQPAETLRRTACIVVDRASRLFPDAGARRQFLGQHFDLAAARQRLVDALATVDAIGREVDAACQPAAGQPSKVLP